MVMRFIFACFLVLSATAGAAVEFDETEVRAMCTKDWPDDQDLQEACLFGEREGFDEFKVSYDPTDLMDRISLDLCVERWGVNWSFLVVCFNEQSEAEADLPYLRNRYDGRVSGEAMQAIWTGCLEKWRPDQARMNFCITRMAWSIIDGN